MASSRESPLATRRSPAPFCGPGSRSRELGQVRVGTVLQPGPQEVAAWRRLASAAGVCAVCLAAQAEAAERQLCPEACWAAPLPLWSGQAQGGWAPQPSPDLCALNCFRRPVSTRVAAGHTPIRACVCSSHTAPSATGSSPVQLQATVCSPRICIHTGSVGGKESSVSVVGR